jgi:hypothetical protein
VEGQACCRQLSGECDPNSAVLVLVADDLGSGGVGVHDQTVIDRYVRYRLHCRQHVLDFVGEVPALKVDVAGGPPHIESRQRHTTFEHETISVVGLDQPSEKALQRVELMQLVGRPLGPASQIL